MIAVGAVIDTRSNENGMRMVPFSSQNYFPIRKVRDYSKAKLLLARDRVSLQLQLLT